MTSPTHDPSAVDVNVQRNLLSALSRLECVIVQQGELLAHQSALIAQQSAALAQVAQSAQGPEPWVGAERVAEHLGGLHKAEWVLDQRDELRGRPDRECQRPSYIFRLSEVDEAIEARSGVASKAPEAANRIGRPVGSGGKRAGEADLGLVYRVNLPPGLLEAA